jgi:putative transposase
LYRTDNIILVPGKVAMEKLWQSSYVCKDVWNILNDEKQRNRLNYFDLKKILPELKKDCPRLKTPSSQVLQEVVKSLCGAWGMYFTKKRQGDKEVRIPRFKSYKYFFTQKYPQSGTSFEISGTTLRLAFGKSRADWIEIDLPSEYSPDAESVKTATISYDKVSKQWCASLVRELPEPDAIAVTAELDSQSALLSPEFFCPLPAAYNPYTRKPVHFIYFDPGCKTTLTGIKTDGTVYEYDINPLRQLNLKHYQLIDGLKSRRDKTNGKCLGKKRGSRQWRRLNRKIRNIYARIEGQTKHYLHRIANAILSDHPDVIGFYIGDWDKRQTLADTGITFVDKRINRQVQINNPVRTLVEYLSYKAARQCKQVEKFGERGTTRTCSCCGYVFKDGLEPSVRTFTCPDCGFTAPRDINSVLNDLYIYRYAVWHSLRALVCLSITRQILNPTSGKNQRVRLRTCTLNYQDAWGL